MGTILHVNAVGLMAAIERNGDRSLAGRPFVVAREDLSRSIVLDMSPEAHREGIRRGMLLALARGRSPGLIVKTPRPALYRAADDLMWRIGMGFTPLVERAGQGHLFMDLAGTSRLHGPPQDATQKIRRMIIEETGVNPSLALASGKTVTKVATRVFRPAGFAALLPHEESALVRLQPVGLLPGIGPVLRDRLSLLEIQEIGALADLGPFEARAIGPRGPDLVARARCVDDSPVDPEPPERRCFRDSHVFEPDTADMEFVGLWIDFLVANLAYAARLKGMGVRKALVEAEYTDGKSCASSCRSPRVLARDADISVLARLAAAKAFSRRVRLRRVAVELAEPGPAGPELDLFEPAEAKAERLQTALDRVHGKYGFSALAPCALLATGLFPSQRPAEA